MFYFNFFSYYCSSFIPIKRVNINITPFLWNFILNKPALSVFKLITKVSRIKRIRLIPFLQVKKIPSTCKTNFTFYNGNSKGCTQSKYSLVTTSLISSFPSTKVVTQHSINFTMPYTSINPTFTQISIINYMFKLDWYLIHRYLVFFFNRLEIISNIYLLKLFSILSSKYVTKFNFKIQKTPKTNTYTNKLFCI